MNTTNFYCSRYAWVTLLIALTVSSPLLSAVAEEPTPPIKIGVIAPLTGTAAHIGEEVSRVLGIIQKRFCKTPCTFILEDGKAGTDSSPVTAMNKLLKFDKVKIVLAASSGEVLPIAPIAEREGALVMGVYSGHPDIKKFGDSVFRTFPDFEDGVRFLAKTLKSENAIPLAIATEEHSFTKSISTLLTQNLGESNVSEENFSFDERDFRSLLLRMRQRSAKAYYFSCTTPRSCATIIVQARQLGIKQPIYSFLHLDNEEFLTAAGVLAEGVRFLGTPPGSSKSTRFKEFLDEYQQQYPAGPRNEFVMRSSFDGAIALLDCVDPDNQDLSVVTSCLYNYRQTGALGDISFNHDGDVVGVNYVMKEIRNGKVQVSPESEARK